MHLIYRYSTLATVVGPFLIKLVGLTQSHVNVLSQYSTQIGGIRHYQQITQSKGDDYFKLRESLTSHSA